MTAGAIRAGQAFVQLYVDDDTVKASLEKVKTQLRTFGAAVDATFSSSVATIGAAATASTATAGTSVGLLTATMGVLRASVYAVGAAFRSVFGYVSTSVLKATALIGVLAAAVTTYLPGGKLAGFLNNFLSKSQTTEALGRWTRFFGLLSGSRELRNLGNRIERLGLGSSIVKGFQNGLGSGVMASLGAGIRSSRSIIAGAVAGVFTAPIRAVAGLFRGAISQTVGSANPLATTAAGASQLAGNLTQVATAGRSAAGALTVLRSVGASIAGIAGRIGGLASAIVGPALLAARTFTTAASDMLKKSKETGESLSKLLFEKFGGGNLVSPEDIQATSELSELFKELKQSTAAAWAQIGIAALPVLTAITQRSIQVADAIGAFLSQNRELITTIITVAARVASFAAGVVALYGAFSAAVPIIGMLMSPLGLVAVGLAGIAYAFPRIRESAVSTLTYLFGGFATLGRITNETLQGMLNALSGGSLQAAARVLWAGLNLAWLTGSQNLRSVWQTMITGMSGMFITLYYSLLSGWESVTNGFISIWTDTQNAIAGGMARLIAMWEGLDVNDVLAQLTGMQNADAQGRDEAHQKRLAQIRAEFDAAMQANGEIDAEKRKQAEVALKAAQDEFAAAKAAAAAMNKGKGKSPDGATAESGLKGTASLGTFSVAAVGRTQIGGIADLKKTTQDIADNTEQIAENTKDGGLAFA